MFTTPGGKHSLKAFSNGEINKTPCLAGLNIVVLPMRIAGIRRQKVSFKG